MPSAARPWLIAVIPLLLLLGTAPVQRTQEARVLETARQMLGKGFHAWLIPGLNGEIRLRKPPLAYWMAAVSFKILGVSQISGRLPTALASWLTLGVTYTIAVWLFGQTTGVLSAACLLGSYLFFRQGRLAETDAPATLFATLAIYYFWRATENPRPLWFHLAAAATGLSLFAKQGPGFLSILFFIALVLVRHQPRILWRFILSGAPLTLLVIAGWWYGYAACSQGLAQFRRELAEVTEGIDHPAWFYVYFPMILLATAPWSLLVAGALIAAAKRAKSDARLAGLLLWAACDFFPLCFVGNKQLHYLLQLMPPLMILCGWLISQAADPQQDPKLARAAKVLIGVTIIASIIATCFIPLAAYSARGRILPLDAGLAAGIAVASVGAWVIFKGERPANAAISLATVWAFALPILLGLWGPTVDASDIRITAAQISRQFGAGPYVFYGGDTSLPLCFALRQEIPRIPANRPDLLPDTPGLAVIWQLPQHGAQANKPPWPFAQVGPDFGAGGQAFAVYQKRH